MLVKVAAGAISGVDGFKVDIEVDLALSMPAFTMVGLADGAVREAKERVLSAIKNSDFKLPNARITINLAPANLKKDGTGYDLPLAIGILAAAKLIPEFCANDYLFAGELSLSGELRSVSGILPLAILAREEKIKGVFIPRANAKEALIVEGLQVYAIDNLRQAVDILIGSRTENLSETEQRQDILSLEPEFNFDFSEVKGQDQAKRAIEIATAGGHNILFIGPPGSGKTMLAQRIPSVLPPLSFPEALEVNKIYSVAGKLNNYKKFLQLRPFRSPHHTISYVGLAGGGSVPRPGEISLAHRGVLFLDEFPEFDRSSLEVLRQPLEDGAITISRVGGTITYPANFMLVAAMNPCPCGYFGTESHACTCTLTQVQKYRTKLSGPLLDRIDLHVSVPAIAYKDLRKQETNFSSELLRKRINKARQKQYERYYLEKTGINYINADLSGKILEKFCSLDEDGHDFLEGLVNKFGLSARSFTKILRVARTIADLNEQTKITIPCLAEAITYRILDRTVA